MKSWALVIISIIILGIMINPISVDAENAFYVYIDELPSWADYASNVMYLATKGWEDVNPGLKFYVASTPNDADFAVKWVKDFGGEHVGYALGNNFIEVGLGDSNCQKKWQPYSENYIAEIMKHEIGHVFGHEHDNDPDSIMYPIALNLEYGLVENEYTLTEGYAQFIPFCTIKDVTSFEYSVSVDDPTYGFDVYVVPSSTSLDDWAKGESFEYYIGQGCSAKNYRAYSNTCNGVELGSGLFIIMGNTLTEKLTQVTVKTREVSTSGASSGTQFNFESRQSESPIQELPTTYGSPSIGDVTVTIGSSVPGCERINLCFSPSQIRAGPGSTITWANADSAAHTITSGTPDGGPDGEFDSSLFMSGTTFSHRFDQTGTYPYLCMVHPWMTGYVIIERGGSVISPNQVHPELHIETPKQPNQLEYEDLAYSSQSTHRLLLDQLNSGIKDAERSLTGLIYESPEAQKKVDEAWTHRGYAVSHLNNGEAQWQTGDSYLKNHKFKNAVDSFKEIDILSGPIGQNLISISNLLDEASNLEKQYQSQKSQPSSKNEQKKTCFLFWCW